MRPCRAGPWILLLVLAGCGRVDANASDSKVGPSSSKADAATVDELRADPSVIRLLGVLDASHETLRDRLGPHRLRYAAHFELQPSAPADRPKVGEVVASRQIVDDVLALDWTTDSNGEQTFHLIQGPPAGSTNPEYPPPGREMILIGETAYAMVSPRGWLHRPAESEVHELWLDDAVHAARDCVAMAAPRLRLGEIEEVAQLDRPALRVPLELGPPTEHDAGVIPNRLGSEWRHAAELTAVSGEIVLDQATGAWLRLDLHLEWTMDDAESRPLRGVLDIEGSMVPDSAVTIDPPPVTEPLPERERLQLERERLLDGLAGR